MLGGQDVVRLRDDCYRLGGGKKAKGRLRSNCDLCGQGIPDFSAMIGWMGGREYQELK